MAYTYQRKVNVPEELRNAINTDLNTPQKLKDAKTFDLSFAIAIGNDGKLKRLPQKYALIYTYLPTSFKFGTDGFPFWSMQTLLLMLAGYSYIRILNGTN